MKLKYLFFIAIFSLAGSALAASPAPSASTAAHPGKHEHWCADNAKECKDQAAKFDQWCGANADKCTALKAEAERHIEYCSQHEKECQEHRERMHDRMQGWCDKHPDKPACKNRPQGAEDQTPPN